MLAEIELRRGLKSEVPVPQIHLVRVHGENLRLGEVSLNLDGQQHFLEFSAEALVGREEKHLAELLGQGAGALRLAPFHQVFAGGAEDAENIHSHVALKVPVLDGNHRVAKDGRNLVVAHNDAVLQGKAADGRAVVGVDFRHHIGAVILQLAHLGEVGRVNKNQSPQARQLRRREAAESGKQIGRRSSGCSPEGEGHAVGARR